MGCELKEIESNEKGEKDKVTKNSIDLHREAPATNRWEVFGWLVLFIAIAIGVYARFKGVGKWPFSGDEFHTAQSVRNILSHGVPGFPCGGYYVRGILLQYLMALSTLFGVSEEFGFRAVTVFFNLLSIPAVYLLAKKAFKINVKRYC